MTCSHKRVGIVTNQPDGYDPERPIYSAAVCDRLKCISSAARDCAKHTFEQPFYRPDATKVATAVQS